MKIHETELLRLTQYLRDNNYRFTTITPASHSHVLSRTDPKKHSLTDIFGWNRNFGIEDIDSTLLTLIEKSGIVQKIDGRRYKSTVRFSTLGGQLFVHSAFPTESEESVFFGPDTYRFIRFLRANLPVYFKEKVDRAIDLGTGTGAGGLSIARNCHELVLSDVNDTALEFTKLNLKINHSGIEAKIQLLKSDLFEQIDGKFDLVIANPPFIADSSARKYRDGGSQNGLEVTKKMILESIVRLNPGGKLILYTGVSIQSGEDPLMAFLEQFEPQWCMKYEEIDPDIFGEELSGENYRTVDRIAAIGLIMERKL